MYNRIGIVRQIIRCAPANGIVNAEPNYLASVDFDAPDLPWLFSRKPASGPVVPWITLAVVDLTDFQADPLSASPVGSQLTIAAAQLPNPAESWMWAHGQMLDTDTVPGDPSRSLSRLICSRKLEPNRRYLACVVPVFAGGKGAGLGIDPGDARTSMDFAWDPADDQTNPGLEPVAVIAYRCEHPGKVGSGKLNGGQVICCLGFAAVLLRR